MRKLAAFAAALALVASVAIGGASATPGRQVNCGTGDQCSGGSQPQSPDTAGQHCNQYWLGWYTQFQGHTWFCTSNGGFHWILIS